jgi:hypothetical protein
LRLPCIADCLARLLDAGFQGCLADELLRPQVFEEILMGGDVVAMGNEIAQDVEDLRAEPGMLASPVQFTAARVECVITKEIPHGV